TVAAGQRLGRHAARPVRDAQRVSEVTHRWEHVWAHLVTGGDAADRHLDRVAHQIAADARTVLRSGLGIVFLLDAASGALHSLGVDGEVIPGDLVPAMRRGQVLPPGCGGAGRAVALGETFIASDYVSGEVVVPPIMAEAVATLPRITTMSVPLIVGPDVIGAVTVGRFRATPLMDYSAEDVRIAARLAKAAAPLLAEAQLAAEHARRQEGASELSRLAGSLTQSLSVSAVCEQLLGLLAVSGVTGRAFNDADVELVQALADQAALGIANARAYDELQVSNVQLLRHEKLVAMGRLTSGLAHELRNPLQHVVGLTSELMERMCGSPREHLGPVDSAEYLRRAYGEAKRAAEIVDRLLDYVRERTRVLESVDVREVVAGAVALVSPAAARRGTQITVTSDDTPTLVRADAIMLPQVGLNLGNHALDAVDGSGAISVRTRTERNGIGAARAVVSVSDTGRGVPAEHLPRMFDPFFTTKDVGHG